MWFYVLTRSKLLCVVVLSAAPHALANVEKVIFSAPKAISIPNQHPNLDNLNLISLSSSFNSVRMRINASFPSEESPQGDETWLLLENLTPKRRYEVRVCWAAIQPTAFELRAFPLWETLDTPELISSLSAFAYRQQALLDEAKVHQVQSEKPSSLPRATTEAQSILFLQLHTTADYFTWNQTLMSNVPPVLADVILDEYLFNVFPKSLVPTAIYIGIVAVIAWFISEVVWEGFRHLANIDGHIATGHVQPTKKAQ